MFQIQPEIITPTSDAFSSMCNNFKKTDFHFNHWADLARFFAEKLGMGVIVYTHMKSRKMRQL
jgi:hypothetical protein